jgi:hypothetical protein
MDAPQPEERRKAIRIKKQLTAQYQELDKDNLWQTADIKDFSENGLVVATEKVIEPGSCLLFRVKIPLDPFRWFDFKAKVIASENKLMRVEVIDMTDEVRETIRKYIAWYMVSKNKNA